MALRINLGIGIKHLLRYRKMDFYFKIPAPITTTAILFLSSVISACGGGGDKITETIAEPIQITESSWKKTQNKSRKKTTITSKIQRRSGKFPFLFSISVKGINLSNKNHWQLHIDADNDPSTGYQFDNQAWSKQSGIDYLIEDGYLFKSTANDSSWSWKLVQQKPLSFSSANNRLYISFSPDLIKNICKEYNIGFVGSDENWQIDVFHPKASSLLNIKTNYCNVPNSRPVITLNGDTPMIVELGKPFVDPGATAFDTEDGDLTANIVTNISVDTRYAGSSNWVKYTVTDNAGPAKLSAQKIRYVTVADPSKRIVVDGNTDDWAFIPQFTQENGNTIKVTDDKDNIYVLVVGHDLGSYTQLFIDSDKNPLTGYTLDNNTGVDFMVENDSLSRYVGTKYQWAWDYHISRMPFIYKNNNVVEMAIPRSALSNLVNTPVFSFASINNDWNVNFHLPEISKQYTLKHSVIPPNRAPTAVNDTAATTWRVPVTINALGNDTDPDSDALRITKITQPSVGVARIVNNKIKFTPKTNFVGLVTLAYTISDSHNHNASAIVSINVGVGINHAPNAVEDAPTTNHTVPVIIDILKNDTDLDGDTLTITSITQPPLGTTATLNADNTVTFDPKGKVGSHAFSYTISDGFGGTDTAVVTIATSDPNGGHHSYPDITDENVTIRKNTSILINVLANDTDADGDILILDQVDSPSHGATQKVPGGVLYTPSIGFTGTDVFYYGVHDGYGHNGFGTVTITVTP